MEENNTAPGLETAIAELKARKERAIQEVSQKYDSLIVNLEAVLGEGQGQQFASTASTAPEVGEVHITVGEFHGMPYTSTAGAILQKTNRKPLKTHDILRHIEKSGRKVEGKNPVGTIYSSLKRNRDFELVAPNTWGLAEWYSKKRKKNVAGRTEEIMREQSPTSLNEAAQRAEEEETNPQ